MLHFARPLLIALAAAPLFAAADLAPETLLPPAPPWRGASGALAVDAAHPWVTPAEHTGLTGAELAQIRANLAPVLRLPD